MSYTKKIKFTNFKAIGELEADFNGCTAIITAGNDKGKTSFLKGMVDRIRFIRPDVPVKKGEKSGRGELHLDTGEKFIWEFDVEGKDKIFYVDQNQVKQSLTKELGKEFFPPAFDVDRFLQGSPKEQIKELQKVAGVDFTEIEERYKKAYDLRTSKNADAEKFHVKLSQMLKVPFVEFVDLNELQEKKEAIRLKLNTLYKENKAHNEKLRAEWNEKKEAINKEVIDHNTKQLTNKQNYKTAIEAANTLSLLGFESVDIGLFLKALSQKVLEPKNAEDLYPEEPKYTEEMPDASEMTEIDAKILAASQINVEAQKYKDYIEYKQKTDLAKIEAEEANEAVKQIEAERKRMIEAANFPDGVSFDFNGVTVDGYPFDKNQISTSKLYTTALKIAAMNLGEVKTIYFDASYLDNVTLKSIEDWAQSHKLQLLIERPALDGGDITYELIEE